MTEPNEIKLLAIQQEVEQIKKDMKENYLKKADSWEGLAVVMVVVAIGSWIATVVL